VICKAVLNASANQPGALHLWGLIEQLRGRHNDAIRLLDQALAVMPDNAEALYNRGNSLYVTGRALEALQNYDHALAINPRFAVAEHKRGVTLASLNRNQEALESYNRALTIKPDFMEALSDRGNALNALNHRQEALISYDRAITINPTFSEALFNRGCILDSLRRREDALASYDQALLNKPQFAEALNNRGNTLLALNRCQDAIASFEQALEIRPAYAEALNNRGTALWQLNRSEEALASFERALAIKPDYPQALNNLGNAFIDTERFEAALISYENALSIAPNFADALNNRGRVLRVMNRWREAVESYETALTLDPNHSDAKFGLCMAELPILYTSELEIASRRAAYASRLDMLCDDFNRGNLGHDIVDGVGTNQPFLLAYQGYNDRDLQSRYGSLVCRIMDKHYPATGVITAPGDQERVRVGIVSGYFRWHSVWKIPIKGWVSQIDRRKFQVFGYHTSGTMDATTEEASNLCDRFVKGRRSLDQWRQTILHDAPHVLLYPDIGMNPLSAALAAQRLASVQCMSLGHPDTSGFPTVDYFLSSDLMEPSDGETHYTEKLVRLPNLSVYYEPIVADPVPLTRADIGMRPTSTVFWCGQSLFKYLPQYDHVFARIAKHAGDCQFAFIQYPRSTHVTDLFKARLRDAFLNEGLRAQDYCIFLPQLDRHQFIAAIGLSDIVLDSIGWSGFNSTLEGMAHNLPLVTLPGPLMRGRHSMAILKRMGINETIAHTLDDYVLLAIRLVHDVSWRISLKAKMAAHKHKVYRDHSCISALEDFLNRSARKSATQ
jgi:predicted O-linked N-acetylglucosamine transferase (SPINDLY family)